MEQQNREIIIKTNVDDVKKRIANLILQFNEWWKNPENQTSVSLHFYTSDEFPMTMGELSRFMDECCLTREDCNVEWNYATDLSLGGDIRLNIIISNSKTIE